MKINSLRYLDRKIGVPICNFLYYLKKALYLHGRHKFEKEKVKKILIIKIWGMGSIISASPIFQNLRDEFPKSEIWFLTKSGMENIYPSMFFDRIVTIKLNGLVSEMTKFIELIYKFRRQKFDLVIDLEIVSRYSAILSYLCGAKTKVGFEIVGQNKDRLYDFKALYHESKHISKIFLGTLDVLGLVSKSYEPFPPESNAAAESKIASILRDREISGNYVVININASELAHERRLPLESFSAICESISMVSPNLQIILIGDRQERDYVLKFEREFLSGKKNIHNLAGEISLPELFVLLKNARLAISNDSGPAHAVAALKTPLIVFFGPETPVIYRPIGDNVSVFYSSVFCSPCISVYKDKQVNCRYGQRCLKEIDLLEIDKAITQYL